MAFYYVQSNESISLFVSPECTTAADPWNAFLFPQDFPQPPGANAIVPSYAWTSCQGYFVFAPYAPASASAFVVTAWAWLSARYPVKPQLLPYLVWVKDPDAPLQSFDADVVTIETPPTGNHQGRVGASGANLHLGTSYTLGLYTSLYVDLPSGDPDAPAFAMTGGEGSIAFLTHGLLASSRNSATLPLTGQRSGCMLLDKVLVKGSAALDESHLDLALRYYTEASDTQTIDSLRFPVLQLPERTSQIAFTGSFDPARPTDPARTRLAFAPGPPIASWLRTPRGQALSLTPRAGAAVVLADFPDALPAPPNGRGRLTAVLEGGFDVSPADGQLVCGAVGTETLSLPADAVLTFSPGYPAFVKGDPSLATSTSRPGELLDASANTAWVSVSSPSQQVVYRSQPQQAPLFAPVPGGGTGLAAELLEPTLLQLWPSLSVSAAPTPSAPAPLVPFAGLGELSSSAAIASYRRLDTRVLAPSRRSAILALSAAMRALPASSPGVDTEEKWSADPHGLLVAVDAATQMLQAVRLTPTLTLERVQGNALLALQSQEVFLVATREGPSAAGPDAPRLALGGSLAVDGWEFAPRLLPPTGALDPTSTVLVVKFAGEPIATLVERLAQWQDAATFNADPAATQALLQALIARARADFAKLGEASLYADFVQLIDDPSWNGAVVLNSAIGTVPPAIAGVLVGIPENQLRAFAIALQVNDVRVTSGELSISRAAVGALVDYENPSPGTGVLLDATGDFGFIVNYLRALFRNSALAQFGCQIGLELNRLFGLGLVSTAQAPPPAPPAPPAPNLLTLNGVYQSHGDGEAGSYSFLDSGQRTFTFTYQDVSSLLFEVLSTLTIDKVQWAPVSSDAAAVVSQFSFWGALSFADAIPAIDLFNYEALVFSKLALRMSSPPRLISPILEFELLTAPTTFDGTSAPGSSDDPSRNRVRPSGLVGSLPLRPAQLLFDPAGGLTVSSLGFEPLTLLATGSPPVSAQTRAMTGLVYDLALGGPGAFAAPRPLTAQLLCAWSPAGELVLGLKLAGLGNRHDLCIEDVLDLVLGSAALDVVQVAGVQRATPTPVVALRLREVSLRFLGKSFPPAPMTTQFTVLAPSPADEVLWYAQYPALTPTGAVTVGQAG
jgi:hypothetical protein